MTDSDESQQRRTEISHCRSSRRSVFGFLENVLIALVPRQRRGGGFSAAVGQPCNWLEQSVWSDFGQNNESVGELWLGLLRFYTEVFDFRADVVCIRHREPVTRLQKSWTSRCIAIEDPFKLDHNLGNGVSRKMNASIMKALIKGRALFGTPFRKPPTADDSYIGYFFGGRQLVDGHHPNYRGCRLCSQIGHRVKDCPRRRGANNSGRQNDRVQEGGTHSKRSRDYLSRRGRAPQDNWRQPQNGA
ncbi:hypothetical protein HPB47_006359 [Ixodes persulcatus]|uniref:Uncharacterized protein n=1 Tax=Ixodes persulcatus TaxID=34615 RepID=A0AC60PB76_IXOPE|nr:hypothetical protein HPB47_006359 [Ixodes persulcatus]